MESEADERPSALARGPRRTPHAPRRRSRPPPSGACQGGPALRSRRPRRAGLRAGGAERAEGKGGETNEREIDPKTERRERQGDSLRPLRPRLPLTGLEQSQRARIPLVLDKQGIARGGRRSGAGREGRGGGGGGGRDDSALLRALHRFCFVSLQKTAWRAGARAQLQCGDVRGIAGAIARGSNRRRSRGAEAQEERRAEGVCVGFFVRGASPSPSPSNPSPPPSPSPTQEKRGAGWRSKVSVQRASVESCPRSSSLSLSLSSLALFSL